MRKFLVGFALIAALSGAACAGNVAAPVVTADSAVVNTLEDFKNAKDVRCDAGQIPASDCQAVAAAFVPVWDAYLTANALVQAEAPLTEVDAAVVQFKVAGAALKDALSNIQENYRKLLLDILEQALRRFDR